MVKSDILLISSAGGHFSELQKINLKNKSFKIITEYNDDTKYKKVDYYMKYGTRKNLLKYFFVFSYNFFYTLYILLKEHPKVIISTGAHTAVPFFIIGKILRIKTIYIESYALVNSKSLTYKLIKNFTDIVIVQHIEMTKIYKDSKYFGGVY